MGSLTDEVAMDCEMVGVSQGTKSALGRVTLVHIAFPSFVFFFFSSFMMQNFQFVSVPSP